MDYQADQKMEETMSPQQQLIGGADVVGAAPAGQKQPVCMREHLDYLQKVVNHLEQRADLFDKRILQLEKLVGV